MTIDPGDLHPGGQQTVKSAVKPPRPPKTPSSDPKE